MATAAVRVLLVDDDEDDFLITRDLLRRVERGRFELEWVSSYEGGLEGITALDHDVYLVDYRLGERSGLDLVREAVRSGCRAPVILLTGQGDHDVDVAAMDAGAADYLVKGSIDAQLLERAIRHALERKRAEEARERLIQQLQAALAQVKTLTGLLPICAWCKRIRDDSGYWNQIEAYVRDHSSADFSHCICPGCAEKFYAETGAPAPAAAE